jgi:hypothetical protein
LLVSKSDGCNSVFGVGIECRPEDPSCKLFAKGECGLGAALRVIGISAEFRAEGLAGIASLEPGDSLVDLRCKAGCISA